jgi:hypothetical protein
MSRMATLMRAELAMAMTAADGVRRLAEVNANYAEALLKAVRTITREPRATSQFCWDRAAAQALVGYRDYVRELAALPGVASMHYYAQLGDLRADARADGEAPPKPAAPPTSSILKVAAEVAGAASRPANSPRRPE